MEIFLIFVSLLCAVLAVAASILPALPGPLIGYFGLLFLYVAKGESFMNKENLIVAGFLALFIIIIVNLIPVASAKIAGASRAGVAGSFIGVLFGLLFFPPFGIFAGALLGAILGELYAFNDLKRAVHAGLGTIIGSLFAILIQVAFSMSILIYIIFKLFSLS